MAIRRNFTILCRRFIKKIKSNTYVIIRKTSLESVVFFSISFRLLLARYTSLCDNPSDTVDVDFLRGLNCVVSKRWYEVRASRCQITPFGWSQVKNGRIFGVIV